MLFSGEAQRPLRNPLTGKSLSAVAGCSPIPPVEDFRVRREEDLPFVPAGGAIDAFAFGFEPRTGAGHGGTRNRRVLLLSHGRDFDSAAAAGVRRASSPWVINRIHGRPSPFWTWKSPDDVSYVRGPPLAGGAVNIVQVSPLGRPTRSEKNTAVKFNDPGLLVNITETNICCITLELGTPRAKTNHDEPVT